MKFHYYTTCWTNETELNRELPWLLLEYPVQDLLYLVLSDFVSAVGLPFGPMYSLVPYLMVGLSIDDMFVLVQTRNNRPVERSQMDLTQRVGLTMMETGVGITVTSVTDVMVFLIGGSTVLPSLRQHSSWQPLQ